MEGRQTFTRPKREKEKSVTAELEVTRGILLPGSFTSQPTAPEHLHDVLIWSCDWAGPRQFRRRVSSRPLENRRSWWMAEGRIGKWGSLSMEIRTRKHWPWQALVGRKRNWSCQFDGTYRMVGVNNQAQQVVGQTQQPTGAPLPSFLGPKCHHHLWCQFPKLHQTRSRSTKGVNPACNNYTGYETMPNSITELRDFIIKNVQDFHHHVSRPSYRSRKPYPAWIDSVPFPPGYVMP